MSYKVFLRPPNTKNKPKTTSYDIIRERSHQIAEELLQKPPKIGYLTISNALQWRLQYRRVIEKAGDIDGIVRVL